MTFRGSPVTSFKLARPVFLGSISREPATSPEPTHRKRWVSISCTGFPRASRLPHWPGSLRGWRMAGVTFRIKNSVKPFCLGFTVAAGQRVRQSLLQGAPSRQMQSAFFGDGHGTGSGAQYRMGATTSTSHMQMPVHQDHWRGSKGGPACGPFSWCTTLSRSIVQSGFGMGSKKSSVAKSS